MTDPKRKSPRSTEHRNDPRLDNNVRTAPLPAKTGLPIRKDTLDRCKSASIILEKLKKQQTENRPKEQTNNSMERLSSVVRLEQKSMKQTTTSTFPKLPSSTREYSKSWSSVFRSDDQNLSPTTIETQRCRRPSLPGNCLSLPQNHELARGISPPSPNVRRASRLLLSSATRRRRAGALLNSGLQLPNSQRNDCRSTMTEDTPQKIFSRGSSPQPISATVRAVTGNNFRKVTLTQAKERARSTAFNSDKSEDSSPTSESSEEYDSSEDEEEKSSVKCKTTAKEKTRVHNVKVILNDYECIDCDMNRDEGILDSGKQQSSSCDTSSDEVDDDIDDDNSNDSDDIEDGDKDDDDDDVFVKHENNEEHEDVDLDVSIDSSLLNQILVPGLPMLDVREQVYLAGQLDCDDGNNEKIKIKKVKFDKINESECDKVTSDVDGLIDFIDETTMLNDKVTKKASKTRNNKDVCLRHSTTQPELKV